MRMTGFLELLRYWLSTLVGAETLARTVWWERSSLTAYDRRDIAALHECRVEMTLHTKSAAHSGHAVECTTSHPWHHAHPCVEKQFIRKHTCPI